MITARRLGKRYGTSVAIYDLSFEIHPGVVTGLIGPDGAGKTTTLRLIAGLETPTSGSVTVAGRTRRGGGAALREIGVLLDTHSASLSSIDWRNLHRAAPLGDPPLLLLDEPLTGLDAERHAWAQTILRRLAAEGRTVVVSSRLMREMQDLADRVLVIERGRLIAEATVSRDPVRTPQPDPARRRTTPAA